MGKDGTSNVSYTLNCRLLFGESPSYSMVGWGLKWPIMEPTIDIPDAHGSVKNLDFRF